MRLRPAALVSLAVIASCGKTVHVAFPKPQVVFRYHDGFTGELLYAEAVPAAR